MSLHNTAWSTANLARNLLDGLDRNKADTTLPTATVELLLNTILDLTVGAQQQVLSDVSSRTIDGKLSQFAEAMRARDAAR